MTATLPAGPPQEPSDYLRGLTPSDRRLNGLVYTPRHLVEFILEHAGYPAAEDATLLDPACGAGIFLQVAAEHLATAFAHRGLPVRRSPGRQAFLKAVESTLYGVDVDAQAVDLAKHAVRTTVAQLCGQDTPPGFFDQNILEADFLTSPHVADLPPAHSGFGFVVGNPPYVSAVRIAPSYKAKLRDTFLTARGRMDFYTLFIERSLGLLAPQGRLAFITPDKYLASQTSGPLRRLLLRQGALRLVARFRSHRVFEDAATVPCVTVYELHGKPAPVALLECSDRPDTHGRVHVWRKSTVKASTLSDASEWHLAAPLLERLATSIQAGHRLLQTLLFKHSAGIATGRDGIYVLPADADTGIEEELLHPAVRGRDLQPFHVSDPRLRLLVPFTFDPKPHLVDLDRYPGAKRYLEAHRSALRARHCVRVWDKAWYDLHDPMPFDIGRVPKILVPDVASHNRFAFDPGHFWPLHSAYYLIPDAADPRFLTALLNSTPIEFLIRLRAPVVKDGFSRYRKQFLGQLPVPTAAPRTQAAIIRAAEREDTPALEDLVAKLFGLTDRDRHAIRRFLDSLPRQAQTQP